MHTANSIRKVLSANQFCFVKFRKLNGEVRNMICTTDLEIIPDEHQPRGILTYDESNQVRVFDVVAREWRSMIPDYVSEIVGYPSKVASGAA